MLTWRLWIGGAAAAAVFLGGLWTGDRLATARTLAATLAAAEERAARAAAMHQVEMERLRTEADLDLALGRVIGDAGNMDDGVIVFDAGRMRQLFPAP